MSCILRIGGRRFHPEAFVKASGLKPYQITQKGDPLFKNRSDRWIAEYFSISIHVSRGDFNDLKKQVADAIRFLKRKEEKLKYILLTKHIEYAELDFGIELRMGYNNVALQSDYFPSSLLKLAGNPGIGIEVSLYPPASDET